MEDFTVISLGCFGDGGAVFTNNQKPILPFVNDNCTSAWAQYSIRVKNRDQLIQKLKTNNPKPFIPTAVHYPMPLHLQECFEYLGYKKGDFPISEIVSDEIMSLPMNPYVKDEEVKYIVKTLKEFNKATCD